MVLLDAYAPDFIWRFYNELLDARLALYAGDLDRADARVSALQAALPRQPAANLRPHWLPDTLVMRAELTLRRGDRRQARAWLEQAASLAQAAYGPAHPDARRFAALLASFDRSGTITHGD